MNDPQDFSKPALVFNSEKFYLGRALRFEGSDNKGYSIKGQFLIKDVDRDRMTVTNFISGDVLIQLEWILPEIWGDETRNPRLIVELYGEDLK